MEEKKLIRSTINTDLPSNSDKEDRQEIKPRARRLSEEEKALPAERPKQTAVIKGKARRQKKTLRQKFSEAFLGDDSKNIGDYILHDVLVPAMKATISDMVTGGIEMALFGERRSGRTTRDRGRTYVNYNSFSRNDRDSRDSRDRGDRDGRRDVSRSTRSKHDFDDIIFDSRAEAEEVLTHLVDLTLDYGIATVSDFYELSNIDSQFTDQKYGWTSLRGACTDRVRNGYVIRLPQPRPID